MGQKVHPHGLRVGVIKEWDAKWYADKKNFADNIVEDYKVKAGKVSSDILKEAHEEAQTIVNRAKVEAEREKEKAADEIKGQVVDLAVLVSSRALEGSIDEEQHRRLIKDFIAKVGI